MQLKLKFLIASLITCFAGLTASAQEENQQSQEVQELSIQHPELNLNDDKTLFMDADSKAKGQSTIKENGVSANNQKTKTEPTPKPSSTEKAEEDPLSFNFLYFIIQKFKISDIVDD